jgi:hypothetical protein
VIAREQRVLIGTAPHQSGDDVSNAEHQWRCTVGWKSGSLGAMASAFDQRGTGRA